MKSRASIALLLAVAVLGGTASATAATSPTLRVGTTSNLSLIGAGFKPRILVTLRVVAPGGTRLATVRTGVRGGFTFRFPSVERCVPDVVTARASNGELARIPVVWFVRECPPPPPLQPGTPPSQPGVAGA